MKVEEGPIRGLLIIQPRVNRDDRGFFLELYSQAKLSAKGLEGSFLQDNLSRSRKNTVRGLHYQRPPFSQGKLVTVMEGEVLDVVVDLRKESSTYGSHFSIVLSAEQHNMLYVPEGFAHGFSVLSENCLFFYKCTQIYNRESEGGILWNDPQLAIDWRVEAPIVSDKDKQLPRLKDLMTPF